MKDSFSKLQFSVLILFLLIPGLLVAQSTQIRTRMADAAQHFIETLSPKQLKAVQFSFNDPNRTRWSNEPQSMYSRKGITIGELNPKQKDALHQLLQTVLSEQGYLKALNVLRLDAYLHEKAVRSGHGKGNKEGSDKYWFMLYGQPRADQPWSWRFEGHHLSLNFTNTSKGISCTPMFYGADPAIFPEGPLAGWANMFAETQMAHQFYSSLNTSQQKSILIQDHIPKARDILTRTGKESFLKLFQGVAFVNMNNGQKQLLKQLVRLYFNNLSPELAHSYLQKIHWNTIYIGWWGGHQKEAPFYYRIHGSQFIIEYCSRLNDPHHIHTLVRFLPTDFGGSGL